MIILSFSELERRVRERIRSEYPKSIYGSFKDEENYIDKTINDMSNVELSNAFANEQELAEKEIA